MKIACVVLSLLAGITSLFAGQTNYSPNATGYGLVRKTPTNQVHSAKAPPLTSDDTAINAVMWRLQNAIRTNDFTYAVDNTYTPYLQKMGGRSQALQVARMATAEFQAQHVGFVSWTAFRPYSYGHGKQHRYAVVRFEWVLEAGGKRAKISGFFLGVRSANTSWQFVNGDQLTTADFKQFFPDFPKTLALPKPTAVAQ